MKRIIYADNAATTRIDPTVLEAMAPFTKEEYANASQPYSFSRKANPNLYSEYSTIFTHHFHKKNLTMP